MNREFLVTKVLCAACGSPVELEYSTGSFPYCDGEPTGSAMVQLIIKAHPCRCTLRAAEELETIKRLLK